MEVVSMDIRTGKTYPTREAAIADGVPKSDIALVERRLRDGLMVIRFTKNSFKSFVRTTAKELLRVK
jgi:hypothetical protein